MNGLIGICAVMALSCVGGRHLRIQGGSSFAGQSFPEYMCIFPIPPTELAANDLFVQNPAY